MTQIRRPFMALLAVLGLAAIVVVLLQPRPAQGRELAVPMDALEAAEVVGVGALPGQPLAVVLLRVRSAEDPVAIFIGLAEAEAIARVQADVRPPRPLTHELNAELMDLAGARVQRLVVDEMREGAYLAALEVKLRDRRGTVWVDSRPSDGLVLAIRHEAEILLSPDVIRAGTSMDPDSAPDATLTGRPAAGVRL